MKRALAWGVVAHIVWVAGSDDTLVRVTRDKRCRQPCTLIRAMPRSRAIRAATDAVVNQATAQNLGMSLHATNNLIRSSVCWCECAEKILFSGER